MSDKYNGSGRRCEDRDKGLINLSQFTELRSEESRVFKSRVLQLAMLLRVWFWRGRKTTEGPYLQQPESGAGTLAALQTRRLTLFATQTCFKNIFCPSFSTPPSSLLLHSDLLFLWDKELAFFFFVRVGFYEHGF
ncbi:hypothetical protein PoB_007157700 [Plakobranchus ocellatus]|uniref:Uncharacterized protein n=1 Tax=Plakobranchus ocellatus TaxID=259542 RepID=A0AAV4DLB5_9GAST|nr:hypothetical protein PoB_007157700 [Plakobranchus ocellatus]